MKYIYGPVPSRRLGLSLGIDLVPYKVCTFDCIYCQVGRTTELTTIRKEYISVDEVFTELSHRLNQIDTPDYITLAGSGEPTLNSRFGDLIDKIRTLTNVPIALITNGSLLYREDVKLDALKCDTVIPTLTSVFQETFSKIHRQSPDLDIQEIIEGFRQFKIDFDGKFIIEIMLIKGYNTSDMEVDGLKKAIEYISPDAIYLNTPVRPPVENFAKVPESPLLDDIRSRLTKKIISLDDTKIDSIKAKSVDLPIDEIYHYITRRPATKRDLSISLGYSINLISKSLLQLLSSDKIEEYLIENQTYYRGRTK